MSISERAKAIYQAEYLENLEADHFGEYVAIEPDSREIFVEASFIEAAMAAKTAHPQKKAFVIRIGYEAAIHLGGATQ